MQVRAGNIQSAIRYPQDYSITNLMFYFFGYLSGLRGLRGLSGSLMKNKQGAPHDERRLAASFCKTNAKSGT